MATAPRATTPAAPPTAPGSPNPSSRWILAAAHANSKHNELPALQPFKRFLYVQHQRLCELHPLCIWIHERLVHTWAQHRRNAAIALVVAILFQAGIRLCHMSTWGWAGVGECGCGMPGAHAAATWGPAAYPGHAQHPFAPTKRPGQRAGPEKVPASRCETPPFFTSGVRCCQLDRQFLIVLV